jgi:hypothetical protein
LTSLTTEQPEQVWADLVSLTLTKGVALSASCLEEVGTLLCVSCNEAFISKNSFASSKWMIAGLGVRRKLAANKAFGGKYSRLCSWESFNQKLFCAES